MMMWRHSARWFRQLLVPLGSMVMFVQAYDLSGLEHLLSPESAIDINNGSELPRWSEYRAPRPNGVIHPATTTDVATTVKWANQQNISFLVYNGGNGWATDFTLNNTGIYIVLDRLDTVSFNSDRTIARIGGGALTSDVIAAGYEAKSLVASGTCDCVGFLGSVLGGGIGYLTGEHGLLVDTVLSMEAVLADGTLKTVTESSNTDLWWALRGAGPNFGIVVEAEVQAYPTDSLTAWQAVLVFLEPQLTSLHTALANLTLPAQSSVTLLYVSEARTPSIIVNLFYHGTDHQGVTAFASLFDIGPVSESSSINSWPSWNSGTTSACQKGPRKPTWGAGLAKFNASAFSDVFEIWLNLVQNEVAENSTVLLNWYPMETARSISSTSSAVAFRDTVSLFASATVSYSDPAFDSTANVYGRQIRAAWQAGDGLPQHTTYINNGFGDESLETIYGHNVERLEALKIEYDPNNRFNQWFPLL